MIWVIDILVTHRRLKGLTGAQLRQLIEVSDDLEALRAIKEHLERSNFKFPHLELEAEELVGRCTERAKEILWEQEMQHLKKIFFDTVTPFA